MISRCDPDDNRVINAQSQVAPYCIVTGDKDLLRLGCYEAIQMVRLADFLTPMAIGTEERGTDESAEFRPGGLTPKGSRIGGFITSVRPLFCPNLDPRRRTISLAGLVRLICPQDQQLVGTQRTNPDHKTPSSARLPQHPGTRHRLRGQYLPPCQRRRQQHVIAIPPRSHRHTRHVPLCDYKRFTSGMFA